MLGSVQVNESRLWLKDNIEGIERLEGGGDNGLLTFTGEGEEQLDRRAVRYPVRECRKRRFGIDSDNESGGSADAPVSKRGRGARGRGR